MSAPSPAASAATPEETVPFDLHEEYLACTANGIEADIVLPKHSARKIQNCLYGISACQAVLASTGCDSITLGGFIEHGLIVAIGLMVCSIDSALTDSLNLSRETQP